LGTYLVKTAPENPPIPLNSLFPLDSTDSDEDFAKELDEFFRFMIWNDLSREQEEQESCFTEDEAMESSISATDTFAECDDVDDIIADDDDSDDGYHLKHPITEKCFVLVLNKRSTVFLATPTKNFPKTIIIEIAVRLDLTKV
jgi:hypothetical protein